MIINKSVYIHKTGYSRLFPSHCSARSRLLFFFSKLFSSLPILYTHALQDMMGKCNREIDKSRKLSFPLNLSTNSKTGQSWLLRRPRSSAAPSLLSREDDLGPRLELGFCEFPACFWFYKRYFLYLGFQTYWYPVRAGN